MVVLRVKRSVFEVRISFYRCPLLRRRARSRRGAVEALQVKRAVKQLCRSFRVTENCIEGVLHYAGAYGGKFAHAAIKYSPRNSGSASRKVP